MIEPLDITGTTTKMLRLPVTADTRTAWLASFPEGPEREAAAALVPEFVVLHLQEATARERKVISQMESMKAGPGLTDQQAEDWLADMVNRRLAQPLPEGFAAEFVRDLQPTQITLLTYAYVNGEAIEDPNVQGALARIVQKQMMTTALPTLMALANLAPLPFSATSLESDPGKSAD